MSSDQVYTGVSNKVLSACPKLIKNQLTGLLDNMKKKVLCQARKFGGNWPLSQWQRGGTAAATTKTTIAPVGVQTFQKTSGLGSGVGPVRDYFIIIASLCIFTADAGLII